MLFFAMPDRYGRKNTMIINYAVHLSAQYLILFNSSYTARLIAMCLYGLA